MIKERVKFMKKYQIINYNELNKNKNLDEYLINQCLNIANDAKFPTDYDDVKEHLFGNDQLIKLFIVEEMDENINIKGFLVADYFTGYNDNNILHCHGIIIHPDIQGLGLSRELVNRLIREYNPDIITAKTHNPRCFNALINIPLVIAYYPNNSDIIPDDIYKVVKTDPYISNTNKNLIYVDAYPDEKIQQAYRSEEIKTIFNRLNPRDAQAIVVVLDNSKLNINNNGKVKSLKQGVKYD